MKYALKEDLGLHFSSATSRVSELVQSSCNFCLSHRVLVKNTCANMCELLLLSYNLKLMVIEMMLLSYLTIDGLDLKFLGRSYSIVTEISTAVFHKRSQRF